MLLNSVIKALVPASSTQLKESEFENVKVFVDGILSGCFINTDESGELGTYALD